ncbi:MAG: thioredoxin domain-containing protein [Deltaproteobacteria bacterium]|nr:thioredoxin domain-containing protein [Deltaproteobacteria bacterium]
MPNRLAAETSPYLLQHAENPVDWYAWGDEAFTRAKAEDKPILLSVGYSACHWCHVMERESFEDAATAAVMNAHFVSVKVDREERPDLDEIYMHAVQAFTGGHGGWPMTVFLTPDKFPFFAGTYFPPIATRGMPSFRDVLHHTAGLWRERRLDIARVTGDLADHLKGVGRLPAPAATIETDWLARVAAGCRDDFDPRFGGFGGAPKFPPSRTVGVLLAHWKTTGDETSRTMIVKTLDAMAAGGLYDVLGGGFARYSVDHEWLIPHFEKMLYDNAELACVYIDAHVAFANETYGRIARETLDYLLRDMTSPEGAFYSSEDADSEGHEGKFYVWTPDEVSAVLGQRDGQRACELFGVAADGNFEHGASVIRPKRALEEMSTDDRLFFTKAKDTLFASREARVRPGRDDKIITAWNALAICALAKAGAVFDDARYLGAAGVCRCLRGDI